MRIRRRRTEPVADASIKVAPAVHPEASSPRRRRGLLAAGGLVLVVLLVVAAVALAQRGDEGDVLALGAAPDASGLAPVEDPGSLGAGTSGDQTGVGPGDPASAAPAGDPAAAPAAGGAAAPGGDPAAAAAGGGSGVAGGPDGGPAAGPVPQRAATGGGGTPTTARPGATQAPTPGPPPPPSCAITAISAAPSSTGRKPNGHLDEDVRIAFSTVNCGQAEYRVRAANGLDLTAESLGGGSYEAWIRRNAAAWGPGAHTITISGGGASAATNLNVS